jgi:hypothetical protein
VNAEIYSAKEVAQVEAAEKAARDSGTNDTQKMDLNKVLGN